MERADGLAKSWWVGGTSGQGDGVGGASGQVKLVDWANERPESFRMGDMVGRVNPLMWVGKFLGRAAGVM